MPDGDHGNSNGIKVSKLRSVVIRISRTILAYKAYLEEAETNLSSYIFVPELSVPILLVHYYA